MDNDLLQLIYQQNQQILDRLDCYATKEEVAAVNNNVIKHDLFINGNGVKGAKSRLDIVERDTLNITEKLDGLLEKMEETVKTVAQQVINKMLNKFLVGVGLAFGVPLIIWAANVIYQASKTQP